MEFSDVQRASRQRLVKPATPGLPNSRATEGNGSHREVAKPAPLPSALEITPCHAGGTRDESKSSQLYVQSTLSIISSVTVNQGLKHDEAVYGRLDPIQTAMRDEKHASPSGPRPLLSMGDHGFRAEDHEHSVFCSTSFLTAAAPIGAPDEAEIQGTHPPDPLKGDHPHENRNLSLYSQCCACLARVEWESPRGGQACAAAECVGDHALPCRRDS